MVTYRVVFVLLWVALLVAGREIWGATTVRADSLMLGNSAAVTDILDDLRDGTAALEPPRVDIFGNEVEEAIGDYRLDPGGDLYERHSPDTEVPHLAPPVG